MLGYPYGLMMTGGVFLLLLLLTSILSSPITMTGHVRKVGNDEFAEFKVRALFGILHYQYTVPSMFFTGNSLKFKKKVSQEGAGIASRQEERDEIDAEKVESSIDKYKQLLQMTRDMKGWVKDTLRRVRLLDWQWSTTVGTGDAMWTAMAIGAVWSVKTSLLGLISQMLHVEEHPRLTVHPVFQYPAFSTEWLCIAQIRFGYAILAGLQLLVRMKKWKGGVRAWQNILFKA
ncbi:DUF2953 domain-containing protein [Paenibacillus sp. HB172176]|uniref:DUF2953 domain-containing protein n=1 Tax=Paenibacillus sp. HB172176 TaxID=2493690 RepID=UPI00143C2E7F|nr:DUF2953 domain-containing protein [Paenibacillus sp. HB172176]